MGQVPREGHAAERHESEPPRPAGRCANCGIETDQEETSGGGGAPMSSVTGFCCEGCAEGGPCTC